MNIANPMLNGLHPAYLVIGYGNPLRQDDGAGYQVADRVADWQLAQVRSLALHQLTPDLAAELAQVQVVIFVDAQVQTELSTGMTIESLAAAPHTTFTGHYVDPRSLLALTQALYQTTPMAYRILIPATQLEFGEGLSDIAKMGVEEALTAIQQLLEVPISSPSPSEPSHA